MAKGERETRGLEKAAQSEATRAPFGAAIRCALGDPVKHVRNVDGLVPPCRQTNKVAVQGHQLWRQTSQGQGDER